MCYTQDLRYVQVIHRPYYSAVVRGQDFTSTVYKSGDRHKKARAACFSSSSSRIVISTSTCVSAFKAGNGAICIAPVSLDRTQGTLNTRPSGTPQLISMSDIISALVLSCPSVAPSPVWLVRMPMEKIVYSSLRGLAMPSQSWRCFSMAAAQLRALLALRVLRISAPRFWTLHVCTPNDKHRYDKITK